MNYNEANYKVDLIANLVTFTTQPEACSDASRKYACQVELTEQIEVHFQHSIYSDFRPLNDGKWQLFT